MVSASGPGGGEYPTMQWGRHPRLWAEFLSHASGNISLLAVKICAVVIVMLLVDFVSVLSDREVRRCEDCACLL